MNLLVLSLLVGLFADAGAALPPPPPPPSATARTAPAPASVPPPTLAETLARIDGLQRHRDDPKALAEERRLVDVASASPGADYAVLWRAARIYIWLADDPDLPMAERSRLGKTGWDLAERAIPLKPNDAEGHYWAAAGMGTYALGIGMMKALSIGLEGKFKERLGRAEQLAPGIERGGVDMAWGRFYEKLPWPKRDRKKAAEHLRRTLAHFNPASLRARVYLAETLLHDDQPVEAKRLLDEVAAAKPGRYDAPEERRAKAMGAALMPEVLKELK